MADQIISDRTARLLIAVGTGFAGVVNLVPKKGETFRLPGFQQGLFPVYAPLTISVLALMRLPGVSAKVQNGILIVLTLLLVGGNVIRVIQLRTIDATTAVGSVVPFVGAVALAA